MQQLRQIIPALMIGVLAGGIGTFQSLQSNQANILSSSYGNGGNPAFTTQSVSIPQQDEGQKFEDAWDTNEDGYIVGTDPDWLPYEDITMNKENLQVDGSIVNTRYEWASNQEVVNRWDGTVDGTAESLFANRYTCWKTSNDIIAINEYRGKNNEFNKPVIAGPQGFEMLLGTKITTQCKDQLRDNELQKYVPTKDTPYSYYGYGIRGKNPWKPGNSIFSMTPNQASEGRCSFQRREKKRWGETKRVAHLQCGPIIKLTPVSCNVTLSENQWVFTHEATFSNAQDITASICTLKKRGVFQWNTEIIKSYETQGKKNIWSSSVLSKSSPSSPTNYRIDCIVNNSNTCSSNSISY